jgi:hypothetical protein
MANRRPDAIRELECDPECILLSTYYGTKRTSRRMPLRIPVFDRPDLNPGIGEGSTEISAFTEMFAKFERQRQMRRSIGSYILPSIFLL